MKTYKLNRRAMSQRLAETHLTINEVAHLTKIPPDDLIKAINGLRRLNPARMKRLSQILGRPIESLTV